MIITFVLMALALYLCSIFNFLLFHSLIEMYTILMSWGIFIITWNSRNRLENGFFFIIGTSFFYFGFIELFHMLSYKGMAIFNTVDYNQSVQFCVIAGYLLSLSFLLATFFINRPVQFHAVMLIMFCCSSGLIGAVFIGIFPICYTEEQGLITFKIYSEYAISIIYLISLIRIYLQKNKFPIINFNLLLSGILFCFAARVFLFCDFPAHGLFKMICHYCQLIAFFIFYHVFVDIGISKPMNKMYFQLMQKQHECMKNEKHFQQLFDNMNEGVAYHQVITDHNNQPVDYIFLSINKSFEQQTGINPSDLLGKKFSEALPDVYHSTVNWVEIFGAVALENKSIRFEEFVESLNKWVDISAFCPEKGYFATIIKDITEHKQNEFILKQKLQELEERVQERSHELYQKNRSLLRSNTELREFSCAISHDLREPVRGIYNLSQLLKENYPENLNHEDIYLLDNLTESSQEINLIIEHVLDKIRKKNLDNEWIF